MNKSYDVIVVGGGPAGLSAACSAKEAGAEKVLIIEREAYLGGILNQCIHSGFGLHSFNEELTGPEFAYRLIEKANQLGIESAVDTMVLNIGRNTVVCCSAEDGLQTLNSKAIILAMGCRERPRGAIAIPGDRPAGVFTAGTAQRYINIHGYMIGKKVVILGSGDIGLIMARRLTLEGAKVLACVEIMPYSNGLTRNIVQCLDDYDIPLYLSHTVTRVEGLNRVERVTVARVDGNCKPIKGSEICFECDTLLLSAGLIPENELTKSAGIPIDTRTHGAVVYENRETMEPGVFACGNVLHVHDLADNVVDEGIETGKAAAAYIKDNYNTTAMPAVDVECGIGISYTVPQKIRINNTGKACKVLFRTDSVYKECEIEIKDSTGSSVAVFRKSRLIPSEMNTISLTKELLDKIKGTSIKMSVNPKKGDKI